MRRAAAGTLLATLCLLALAGCGGSADQPPRAGGSPSASSPTAPGTPAAPDSSTGTTASTPTARSHPRPRVVGTAARDLAAPWGIAFLPGRDPVTALVTERDSGRVLLLRDHHTTQVGWIPVVSTPGGESGLLGIAVSPAYEKNHRVFLYACSDSGNRVLRGTLRHGQLTDVHAILTGIPHGIIHDGGRLRFGPDGYLYVSTGETGNGRLAQDKGSLGGKILRITEDGAPAPGNPFGDSPVWTYGHRNVEGLAFDADGRMWASEFGENTWDELNRIRRGHDYGWPVVEGRAPGHPRFTGPAVQWHTGVASPSGLAYDAGSLWLGALRGQRLWEVPLHDGHTGKPHPWFIGKYGRMRTVARAPDGHLWVTTSNTDGRGDPGPHDDRILVIRP